MAPADADGSTPVGDDVALDFGVDASLTWVEFLPPQEWDLLVSNRTEVANLWKDNNPAILTQLDQDWRQAAVEPGHQDYHGIGEEVAARWQQLPGFDWVNPATSWHELYTDQAYAIYNALPRTFPTFDFQAPGLSARYLWSADNRNALSQQMQNQLLPILRYATTEEVTAYVQGLSANQKIVLRFGLGFELTRLQDSLASDANARTDFLLYQQLYSEVNSSSASAYGLHSPTSPMPNYLGFNEALSLINANQNVSFFSLNLAQYNRGTLAQRIAFLADLDYNAFIALEEAHAASNPSRSNWPSAEQYYQARNALIQGVLEGGNDLTQSLRFILSNRYGGYPLAGAVEFLYERYIRGYYFAISADAFYAEDRYNQVNMAHPYLAGWRTADDAQKGTFADYLYPMDRAILLSSLARAADAFRASGDTFNMQTAQNMAAFIGERFRTQQEAVGLSPNPPASTAYSLQLFRLASTRLAYQNGSTGGIPNMIMGAGEAAQTVYSQFPQSIKLLAYTISKDEFKENVLRKLPAIEYVPGIFGLRFLDRTILYAADFLAPFYRYYQRTTGLFTGVQVDAWGDLHDLRRWVETGDFRGITTGQIPQMNNSAFTLVTDTLIVGATLLTAGAGSGARAVISGGRFLPGSLALARNQILSGLRSTAVFTLSGAVTSGALATIDSLPLQPQWRGPLRFATAIIVGFRSAQLFDRILPKFQPLIVKFTQELSQVTSQIRTLTSQGRPVPPELNTQAADLMTRINQWRAGDGANGTLVTSLENQLLNRLQNFERLEALVNTPGLAPSLRRLVRLDLGIARTDLRTATRNLLDMYNTIDRAAIRAALGSGITNFRLNGTPPPGTATSNFSSIRRTVEFLTQEGITDANVRRQIIEAGLTAPINPATNPQALARFRYLLVERTNYTGRLGDLETRVATINEAVRMENSGLLLRFENYRVTNPAGDSCWPDIVGLDPVTNQPVRVIQCIRAQHRAGGLIDFLPHETENARIIEEALGPGILEFIITGLR